MFVRLMLEHAAAGLVAQVTPARRARLIWLPALLLLLFDLAGTLVAQQRVVLRLGGGAGVCLAVLLVAYMVARNLPLPAAEVLRPPAVTSGDGGRDDARAGPYRGFDKRGEAQLLAHGTVGGGGMFIRSSPWRRDPPAETQPACGLASDWSSIPATGVGSCRPVAWWALLRLTERSTGPSAIARPVQWRLPCFPVSACRSCLRPR